MAFPTFSEAYPGQAYSDGDGNLTAAAAAYEADRRAYLADNTASKRSSKKQRKLARRRFARDTTHSIAATAQRVLPPSGLQDSQTRARVLGTTRFRIPLRNVNIQG